MKRGCWDAVAEEARMRLLVSNNVQSRAGKRTLYVTHSRLCNRLISVCQLTMYISNVGCQPKLTNERNRNGEHVSKTSHLYAKHCQMREFVGT